MSTLFGNEPRFSDRRQNDPFIGPGVYYDEDYEFKRLWKVKQDKVRPNTSNRQYNLKKKDKLKLDEINTLNKALQDKGIILTDKNYRRRPSPGPCSYNMPDNNKRKSGIKIQPPTSKEDELGRLRLDGILRNSKGKNMYFQSTSNSAENKVIPQLPGPGHYNLDVPLATDTDPFGSRRSYNIRSLDVSFSKSHLLDQQHFQNMSPSSSYGLELHNASRPKSSNSVYRSYNSLVTTGINGNSLKGKANNINTYNSNSNVSISNDANNYHYQFGSAVSMMSGDSSDISLSAEEQLALVS